MTTQTQTEVPTYPTCPECGATGRSCKRPTGGTTSEWHAARKALLVDEQAPEASAMAADDDVVEDLDVQARLLSWQQLVFYRLSVDAIDPHPSNPRRTVGDVADLAKSIQTQGILEPLVVGPAGEDDRYVLIAGHRRLAAARIAGLTEVPCVVRRDLDTPARQLEAMLVENLHRADLSPIEEAEGYQALLEFPGFTQTTVAREVGQPVSRIRERLKLTKAPEPVKAKLHAGQITITDGSVVDEADGRVRCASCHDVVRSRSVYVASSWRNPFQPGVVAVLRAAGMDVYDFRNPPGGAGFGWEEVMPGYTPGSESVLRDDYLEALQHPRAVEGYAADFAAMQAADTFVLVLPCGRSAHLELGWAVGAGKRTAILCELPDQPMVPELMYKLADHIAPTLIDLLKWLGIPN